MHDISVSAVFVNDQGSKLVISITQPMAWVTSSICKSISKVLEPCSQGLLDFLMKTPEIRLVSLTSIQLTHVHHNLDKMPAETENSVVHTERETALLQSLQ